MKKIVLAIAMTLATSAAFASNDYVVLADNCPVGYEATPSYKWDSSAHKFVFVGYICKKVKESNH